MRDPKLFPPIKPEHAQAIGYVAAHWSLIEEQLGFIIYNLLNLHTLPGAAVTAELNTLQRLTLITTLIALSGNNDWIDKWALISKTLDGLRNRRNDAIHSTWRVIGAGHMSTRTKARGQLKIKYETLPTSAPLEDLSKEILSMVDEIDAIALLLLHKGAAKVINRFHPPGWIPPTQSQESSQEPPSQNRNPKRERQQKRRKERRAFAASSRTSRLRNPAKHSRPL
jgi:hypothetical protein